jgi:thiamine biosynthesis lipoprotein
MRPWLRVAVAAGLAVAASAGCAGSPPPVVVADGRRAMGTVLEITLVANSHAEGRAALDAAFAEVERLGALLTTWDPDSELMQMNRAAGRGPRAVDPDLARVVAVSLEHSRDTRGSFDPTVGPLVALWARAAERGAAPDPDELAAALARVGAGNVVVGSDGRVALSRPGVSVDLGGVAKGYALDRILAVLERFGIEAALLNFGRSSTWAKGRPPDARAWRLLARGPGEAPLGVLELSDRALSVSGSLGQSIEIGGRRYGHVLDPRTGFPLERELEVYVVAPDAALAEALSKAVLVLGPAEGLGVVAEHPGCEALLLAADGARWRTRGWDAAVGW